MAKIAKMIMYFHHLESMQNVIIKFVFLIFISHTGTRYVASVVRAVGLKHVIVIPK